MENNKSLNNQKKPERITKKDIVYSFALIYLISIIALLLTWKLHRFQEAIDQISLVSSIASILLALVAIVYAFFQTTDSSKQSEVVHRTLIKIDDKIGELQNIKDEFSSIKEEFGSFRGDLSTIISSLAEYKELLLNQPETIFAALKNKNVIIPAEVEEDVKTEVSKNVEKIMHESSVSDHTNSFMELKPFVEIFILVSYKPGDIVPFNQVKDHIKKLRPSFNDRRISSITRRILHDLADTGFLRLERTEDNMVIFKRALDKEQ